MTKFQKAMNKKFYQILVIDDDTRLRTLLGRFLSENNFNTSLAKDTGEARDLMTKNNFDLLIVDAMMPSEDGISFTNSIRQNSNYNAHSSWRV